MDSQLIFKNETISRFFSIEVRSDCEENYLNKLYNIDHDLNKITLSAKYYKNEKGEAWIIKDILKIEEDISMDPKLNHEYLHPLGLQLFRDAAAKFLLGDQSRSISEGRAFGVQTVGGTGAITLALEFLNRQMGYHYFYLSSPASDNAEEVFQGKRGKLEIRRYFYWDPILRRVNFEEMIEDLKGAPENAVILLQMCCHRPTGCDLTKDQWMQIADIMEERKLFPLFDSSYQGFASGDPEEDAWPVRYFADRGFELLCTQSFSANFGLYDCRVGNITFVVNDPSLIPQILSECTWNSYNIIGTPANRGIRIILSIWNDVDRKAEWLNNLKMMHLRIQCIKQTLRKTLELLDGTLKSWNHITEQKGFLCFSGLHGEQIEYLRKYHHIYLEKSGWFNLSCLNRDNMAKVANAFNLACDHYSNVINNNNNNAFIQNAYIA